VIEIVHSRSVESSPAEVWQVLADFHHLANWAPGVSHSSAMIATPPGLGAARRVQAGAIVLVETVVEWEPGRVLGYDMAGLPPLLGSASNRWMLAAIVSGTDIAITVGIEPRNSSLSKTVARLVARRIAKANRRMLDGLVATVQQERPDS